MQCWGHSCFWHHSHRSIANLSKMPSVACFIVVCLLVCCVNDCSGARKTRDGEKQNFKVPRIMSHPGSHPWQLEPVVTNRDNWLGTIDKDKLILQLHRLQFKSMYDDNDQYDDMEVGNSESAVTEPPAPATTTTREELIERLKNVQAFTRLLEKVKQIHQTQSSSIGYNPLPYGGPQIRDGIRLVEDVEQTFRAKQTGMPVARTTKNKNETKMKLKMPIPDSEIPNPGHYRQPVNPNWLLQAINSQKTGTTETRTESKKQMPINKNINVEAFRILMDVIKSIRDSGDYASSDDVINNDDDAPA